MTNRIFPDTYYIIKSRYASNLYWNNRYGWTNKEVATRFTVGEYLRLRLPIDGNWVRMGDKIRAKT